MLGELLREFPGTVRLVLKDFPLEFHEGAMPAALAARCAARAGRFWEYHDLLFATQPAFARSDLLTYAGRLGLDGAAFARCLDRQEHRASIERDIKDGRAVGVTGTPTFLVNGRVIRGALPLEAFRDVVRDALAEARRSERKP